MRGRIKLILFGAVLGVSACLLMAATPFVYAYASLPVDEGRGHDGSSLQNAIVIEVDSDQDAVAVEYEWLGWHCMTCTVLSQSLVFEDECAYDVLELQKPDGTSRLVYFDITRAYGNW